MKLIKVTPWVFRCLAGCLPISTLGADCTSLDQVEWMLGHWESRGEQTVVVESWTRVSADTFEGFGEVRSARDDRLQSREALRLVQMAGGIFFVAKVAHNEFPVAFRQTGCEAGSAVFENTGHDFPTRIAYRRLGDERMAADVKGADSNGFQLEFRRQAAAWAPGDSDLLFSSSRDGDMEIYLLESGSAEWRNLTGHPAADNWPVWSPDGARIAFQSRRYGKFDIFVMDADGSNLQQLTDHPEHDYLPSWTHDGSQITFASWRTEPGDEGPANHVYIMNADGSDQRRLLPQSPGTSATVQWARDGRRMIRTQKRGEQGSDLYLADARGLAILQLTDDEASNAAPAFSPGGSQIAFYSDNGSSASIEIISSDGSARRTVVGAGKNYYPRWSPDGCWLVYSAIADPDAEQDIDVRAARADGSGEWLALVTGPGREGEASWRPTGQGRVPGDCRR